MNSLHLPLKSPRASPKKPASLSSYWKSRHEFQIGERLRFEEYGKCIRRAMDAGQTHCTIIRFLRRDFVAEQAIVTPRGGVSGQVTENNAMMNTELGPLIKWILEQGCEWKVVIPLTAAGIFNPIYSQWADFVVYWEPKLEVSERSKLLDYWIRLKTVKCMDDSSKQDWYKTVQRAMDCGMNRATLMSLYRESDFMFEECEFQQQHVRLITTLQPVKANLDLVLNKFEAVLTWIHSQELQIVFLVNDAKDPSWAYLVVEWIL